MENNLVNSSPLAEVDPKSLDELFDRDPLELTKDDLSLMVVHYRNMRAKWATEQSTPKTAKKADKLANNEATKGIGLSDLDIEI